MESDKELLEDISFDREICQKDKESDLLMLLLENKSFNIQSAVKYYKYDILQEEKNLKKRKLIKIQKSKKEYKVWLTEKGKIVALGELSLRQREKSLNDG